MNARRALTVLAGGLAVWALWVLVRDGPDATLPAGPVLVLVSVACAAGAEGAPRVPVTRWRTGAAWAGFGAVFAGVQVAWGASAGLALALTLPVVALAAATTLALSRRRRS